ncbi:hypothetical protein G6F63_016854 [Rhizopus arrhizus]|nr:hypothetical protein G6F63_016854 [Rhizopus arrhizus]
MPPLALHLRRLTQRQFDRIAGGHGVVPQAFRDLPIGFQIALHGLLEQGFFRSEGRVEAWRGNTAANAGFQLAQRRGFEALFPE